MNKKILIWDKGLPLQDIGGPSGYLYNIHTYLEEHSCDQISFYSDIFKEDTQESYKQKTIKNRLKSFGIEYPAVVKRVKCLINHNIRHLSLTKSEIDILNQFQYVHFHSFILAWAYIDSIREYCPDVKIILTTHTPEPYCDEYCSTVGIEWLFKIPYLRRFCLKNEVECLKRVDYIMYPVPQVKEVYSLKNTIYKKEIASMAPKIFYVPTAILDKKSTTNERYLEDRSWENELRVCFVGRHNKVKGYDFLKNIALKTWEKNANVTFVIGGAQKNVPAIKDSRWIELGWVNTDSLLNSVDVFVLPNQQTYYDLILLEVLRAGKPILLTDTGGNKYFEQFYDTGLLFCHYGDTIKAADILHQLYKEKEQGQLKDLGVKNRKLFTQTSTMSLYIENYLKEISRLK